MQVPKYAEVPLPGGDSGVGGDRYGADGAAGEWIPRPGELECAADAPADRFSEEGLALEKAAG